MCVVTRQLASNQNSPLCNFSMEQRQAHGVLCRTGPKELVSVRGSTALPISLRGPGSVVYISDLMPDGTNLVVRAVHSELRCIDVILNSVVIDRIMLSGRFCATFDWQTVGDTLLYVDDSLKTRCLRLRNRNVIVSLSGLNVVPRARTSKCQFIHGNLYTVNDLSEIALIRCQQNQRVSRGRKRSRSCI